MQFDIINKTKYYYRPIDIQDIVVTSSNINFKCRECGNYLGGANCSSGIDIKFPEMIECANFEPIICHNSNEVLQNAT